jgi:hypothetical protein
MKGQTHITEGVLPKTELGNDPNDNRADSEYFDHINLSEEPSNPTKTLLDLEPLNVELMLRTEPIPREYLFIDRDEEGFLVSGTGAGIAAPGGAGKSTVVLGFAYALAVGGVWLGEYQTKHPMKVYLFTAEENENEIHHRLALLHRWYAQQHPIGETRMAEIERLLAENLRVYSLLGAQVDLTIPDGVGGFTQGRAARDAVAIVNTDAGNEDSVVIFDPLRKLTAGNEDGAALSSVIKTCDWIRENTQGTCTTLILHHSSQMAQKDSDDTQSAFRGATDLVDGLRWTMVIQKLSRAEAKKLGISDGDRTNYRSYSFPKSNYSTERYGMYLKYSAGTYLHTWIKSAAMLNSEEKAKLVKPIMCRVLAELEKLGEPVSAKSILTRCKANPVDSEVGSYIPVGRNQESLRNLLLEARKEGFISSYQTIHANNKKGEAWKLTTTGRELIGES